MECDEKKISPILDVRLMNHSLSPPHPSVQGHLEVETDESGLDRFAVEGGGGGFGGDGSGNPMALMIQAQPSAKGIAIGKVMEQSALSGYFYAGYDETTGSATHTGGIKILQTKTGTIEGAAFLDPAQVAKMKLLPKGQVILTNSDLQ